MSCLAKIRASRDELSPNERKIAQFILASPALIRDYSSLNLAHAVGVSQSSIVKFSQKLGYRGFTDLKLAIHEAVLRGNDPCGADSKGGVAVTEGQSIGDQLFRLTMEAIGSTLELNDENRITAAVDLLESSGRIMITAFSNSIMVAEGLASKMMQIGRPVISATQPTLALTSAGTLGKGDLVFAITFKGQSPQMLQTVKAARRNGVSILSLTDYCANPVRALADVELYSDSRGNGISVPQLVATASQQFITDLLFSELVARDRQAQETIALGQGAVNA